MSKASFLRSHVAALIETVAAPSHADVERGVRDAFKKSRLELVKADEVTVSSKAGLTVTVIAKNRRPLRYKQVLRLRAYLHHAFILQDLAMAPTVAAGRACMVYRIRAKGLKQRTRTKT